MLEMALHCVRTVGHLHGPEPMYHSSSPHYPASRSASASRLMASRLLDERTSRMVPSPDLARVHQRCYPCGIREPFGTPFAPLAQLDRASGYGPGGWGFESSRAHSSLLSLVTALSSGADLAHSRGDPDPILSGFPGLVFSMPPRSRRPDID